METPLSSFAFGRMVDFTQNASLAFSNIVKTWVADPTPHIEPQIKKASQSDPNTWCNEDFEPNRELKNSLGWLYFHFYSNICAWFMISLTIILDQTFLAKLFEF